MKGSRLEADPRALSASETELGWVDVDRTRPEIADLAERLEQTNGLAGLEVLDPAEVERAKAIFYRDGFVVVRDALDAEQLESLRAACDRVAREILARDKDRLGNRGTHRYSFGGASQTGHMMHHPEWAMLIDLPTITPILTAIFESRQYIARGGGGDFCLPGAVDYQVLHSDMQDRIDLDQGSFGSFKDPRGSLTYRDLPCPYIACNFLMVDSTPLNGPTRQIPGTQHSRHAIPKLDEEPEWMRLSTVCPAPAGSALIRDVRAWHGGTPNLTDQIRAIPNAEFFAPWFREPLDQSMPRSIFDGLSAHGRSICRYIVAEPGEKLDTGYRDDLGRDPLALAKA